MEVYWEELEDKMKLVVDKTYRLEVEKGIFRLVKITAIKPTHIEGYFLDEPSRAIGITNNEHLLPFPTELLEINDIKAQGLPKITQDDINDMIIDLNIYIKEGKS